MRVLFIGGAGMTGPFAVRELLDTGHQVWLLHRSQSDSELLRGSTQVEGDRANIASKRDWIAGLKLDVIVHMMAFTEADATRFMQAVAGVVPRAVMVSSMDVYRAYGRLGGTEPGPPDSTPLTEDSPLREKPSIRGDAYEKIAVERVVRSDPRLAWTILRYPAVYGPGDRQHRLRAWVRRMDERRPFILIGQSQSSWRFTHGYVQNMAAGLVRTIVDPRAIGHIYNIGDAVTLTWAQWAQAVGRAAGWAGRVVIVPDVKLPPHLKDDVFYQQDWAVDCSRIQRELGHVDVVEFDEGLKRAVAWERKDFGPRDEKEFDYAAEDAAVV